MSRLPRLASCLIALATAPASAQGQPIPNASFERLDGDAPADWRTHTWAGRGEFALAGGARTGDRCVSIRSTGGVDGAWYAVVPVRMHSTYRLSGWIRTEGVEAGRARGALLNVHDLQPVATGAVTGTSDWTRVEVEFATGAHDSIQINCLLGGWGRATGTAWFDDLALERLATEPWDPRVRIDATAVGEPISPLVYGQFIEHLGRCIYGGIWAELLEDRKFFAPVGGGDSPWRALPGSTVAMSAAAAFVGAHAPVVRAEHGGAGIAQAGLGLVAGRRYQGRVWLAGTAPAEVRLIWGDGPGDRDVVEIAAPGDGYRKTEFELGCRAASADGRIEIVAAGPGELRIGTVSLMPDDHVHGMRADTLALLRELDAPIYRWPGGNFVSGYDWRDGIGDRDRRPPRKNPAWRGIEHNDFGIDEFMTFCRLLGTEPYVVVNSGLGEVGDAVAELEYCNGDASTPMGALRARHGHEEPYRVRWWGVGNEMYGDWQLGHMPLERYVDKHRQFAGAMRAADSSIRLVAVGAAGAWSEGMLEGAADRMDLISEHFYVQERRGVAAHALQARDAVRRIAEAHRGYRTRIDALAGRDVRIALDEWNYWYGPHVYGELGTRYYLKDALGVAAALHEIARHSDLFLMANYAQTVNVIGCIKTTATAAAFATTGLVLKLYRRELGTVPVRVDCPSPLDVVAALTADRTALTIAAVNPTGEPIAVPLELHGVALARRGRRWRIAGDDPMAYNDPGRPPAVAIVEDEVEVGDRLELAAYGVTLVRVDVADAGAPTAARDPRRGANLAVVAEASASYVSGDTSVAALNDGFDPERSYEWQHGTYGNWPRRGTQWVQYSWPRPVHTGAVDVYWWDDRRGVRLPRACRLLYWDGAAFVPVPNAEGLGVAGDRYATTTFDAVRTDRLRLEIDARDEFSTGILEWKVYDAGGSPDFPPRVRAGGDRIVVRGGATYLDGRVRLLERDGAPPLAVAWRAVAGPGAVTFADAGALATAATFDELGEHTLELTAERGGLSDRSTLRVTVVPPPPATHLEPVETARYRVDSPLWSARLKAIVTRWIPHCIARIADPELREGGIDNFVEAAKKLAGEAHGRHRGYVFSNAWVLNTIEAICVALMVDGAGDPAIEAAQQAMRATLDDWIPKVLAAQEPDGYLQTAFTLSDRERWAPRHRGDHEGYVAGYLLEAAIAHRRLTRDPDDPLWLAARRLADCWDRHIGPPPKRPWFDGHQGMELALLRFGRFVDEVDGAGRGDRYLALAKFLLDCRGGGSEYDQSHLPVVRQYEAVGHAVRAAYSYAAMAGVAMATGDTDYHSAVASLWDNIVHRKYYVTGGIGSGETSEGFGGDYSLRSRAYCESCSSCGLIFLQHRLALTTHEARYADLYEETLYNALLGSLDLAGERFYYTNPLATDRGRDAWHVCPCCVGNIPRTLLMLPVWTYAKAPDGIFVNLFVGSTMTVDGVAGTDVELEQRTDYPWSGDVAITVRPAADREFALHVRVPDRSVSDLYDAAPAADSAPAFLLNGEPVAPPVEHGYAVIRRRWTRGDTVELALPMPVQRITAIDAVEAARGRVALRRGPLIYAVEDCDQRLDGALEPATELATAWRDDLLGGVVVLRGTWADGSPLTAIPYYARANRVAPNAGGEAEGNAARPRSRVWIDARR